MRKDLKSLIWITVGALLALGLGAVYGCGAGTASQPVIYYSLEYPPPDTGGMAALPTALKVQRITAAGGLDSLDMVYGPSPLELSVYNYHRWRVSPGEMAGDFLVRDFRHSGLFQAVFSYRDGEKARFNLEGSVESFREEDQDGKSTALVRLNLTLLDRAQSNVADRVVFQRWYKAQAPMTKASARAQAQGISRAMSQVAAAVIKDLHQAIGLRLQSR